MGDRRSTQIAKMMVLCWRLTFLPPRSKLLSHAFVWVIYIYIESIKVTCRSTVAKIVLMGNLRWPSSCLCLFDPNVEMWLIVYLNYHAPLTVRPIYSSSKLSTAQMMIFSLVAMIGLEKCCITSAYLQWLCHSGERAVARGPLVTLLIKCYHVINYITSDVAS